MNSEEVLRLFMVAPPTGPIQDWPQLRKSIGEVLDEIGRLRADYNKANRLIGDYMARLKVSEAKNKALRDWQRRCLIFLKHAKQADDSAIKGYGQKVQKLIDEAEK